MQVRRGGKTAWYSRCPRWWSRTSARNAAVVSSETATWSGWPYPPSAPKVINRVRIELPHDAGDRGAQRGPMVLQGPVRVGQHLHALHAELGGSRAKLALPDRAERPPGRGGGIADLPPLAAGGRDDHDLGARLGRPGHRAASAEHLVVRMREDAEQAPRRAGSFVHDDLLRAR